MVSNIFNFPVHEEKKGDVKVSYSQYTMWANCPKQWKLTYMDGHRDFDPSIHLVFGTAMHETLQAWLQVMYNQSAVEAEKMDLNQLLLDEMAKEYKKMMAVYGVKFTNRSEMNEFYDDGVQIIDFLKKNRSDYFSTRKMRLVGVELPIYFPASEVNENVMMKGFLDLVFEVIDDGSIEIWDIKTSTKGWNKWQKADKTKTAQLVLYKKYFAEQYGFSFPYLVDEDQIVCKTYGAVCTPDFFGFNGKGELQYRGRLDDARMGDVSNRTLELLNAMRMIAKTGNGPEEQIPSMGCSIKWRW